MVFLNKVYVLPDFLVLKTNLLRIINIITKDALDSFILVSTHFVDWGICYLLDTWEVLTIGYWGN